MIHNVSFTGIVKPYTNKNGYHIVPIHKNPTGEDVQVAINATKGQTSPFRGFWGEVYPLGKDLVVKRYSPKSGNGENKESFEREVDRLDMLYKNGVKLKSSQEGLYGIVAPDNEYYLVSTRVMGARPNPINNPFTKENLEKLIDCFIEMDKGSIIKPDSASVVGENKIQTRARLMHHDVDCSNINISPNSAGLFDFEWVQKESLESWADLNAKEELINRACHRSDTSVLPSNLRSFEHKAFAGYLYNLDNPKEMFLTYLGAKSNYHKKRAEALISSEPENSSNMNKIKEIAQRELIHGIVLGLENLSDDIVKSEAIKIEMSIMMANVAMSFGKINIEQAKEFMSAAIEFLEEKYQQAKEENDSNLEVYYKDCLDFMQECSDCFKAGLASIYTHKKEIFNALSTNELQTRLFDKLGFSLSEYKPNTEKETVVLEDGSRIEKNYENGKLKAEIKLSSDNELQYYKNFDSGIAQIVNLKPQLGYWEFK